MPPKTHLSTAAQESLEYLLRAAWDVRENAHVIGPTKVGCAILGKTGKVFVGCNIEHRFRSHDIHAEISAIAAMVSSGETQFSVIVIAADRERFTPCGSCMDWIMQFAADDCTIASQQAREGPVQVFSPRQLMPFYPK